MDDHTLIEQTTQSFQRDSLTQFMRVARGKLKPERPDRSHILERTVLVRDPLKPDGLDFDNGLG
jgi:hypothetical protein